MKNKMNKTDKKEALQNALSYFKFPSKYFVYEVNAGNAHKFSIASKNSQGGIDTHSKFMSYDEFNSYLFGWYDAKMKKF